MPRIALLLEFFIGIVLVACSPPIPDGRFACGQDADCPTGWFCRSDQRCYATSDDADASLDASVLDAGPSDAGAVDAGPSDSGIADAGSSDAGTCGDGICSGDEDCGECNECWMGHLGTGKDKDPCKSAWNEQWRCVYEESHKKFVPQTCVFRPEEGGWIWLTMNTRARDCEACVCDFSIACCIIREKDTDPIQLGCPEDG